MKDEELPLRILLMSCRPDGAYASGLLVEFSPEFLRKAIPDSERTHLNKILRVLKDLTAQRLCTKGWEPSIGRGPGRQVYRATPEGRKQALARVNALNELATQTMQRSGHEHQ